MVPITINDQKLMALLDTGANVSVVSESIIEQLDLFVIPKTSQSSISLAHADSSIPRIGTTPITTLVCGAKSVHHQFEVMRLPLDIPAIIGMDLFDSLGFSLHDVPVSFPEPQHRAPAALDFPPNIVDSPDPLDPDRNVLLRSIQSALDRNCHEAPKARCSHPLSVIHLDTGDAPPVWRNQYPIAKGAESAVSTKVQEWIDKGIVVDAPAC